MYPIGILTKKETTRTKRKRRHYDASFKAGAALEAIKELKTLAPVVTLCFNISETEGGLDYPKLADILIESRDGKGQHTSLLSVLNVQMTDTCLPSNFNRRSWA